MNVGVVHYNIIHIGVCAICLLYLVNRWICGCGSYHNNIYIVQ